MGLFKAIGGIIGAGKQKKATKKAVAALEAAGAKATGTLNTALGEVTPQFAPYQSVGVSSLSDIVSGMQSGRFSAPDPSTIGADRNLIGADTSFIGADTNLLRRDPSQIGSNAALLERDPSMIGGDTSLLGVDPSQLGADISLLAPVVAPNAADFQASPDYLFRQAEAMKAVQTSAAARGGLDSGATLKALLQRSGDLAGAEFGNWWERTRNSNLDTRAGNVDTYQAQYRTGADRFNAQEASDRAVYDAQYRTSSDRYAADDRARTAQYDAQYRTSADRFEAGRLSDQALYDAQYRTGADRYNADYATNTARYEADYRTSGDRYNAGTASGDANYRRLSDLAGLGYRATGDVGNAVLGNAGNVGNIQMGVGNAQAAGYIRNGDLSAAQWQGVGSVLDKAASAAVGASGMPGGFTLSNIAKQAGFGAAPVSTASVFGGGGSVGVPGYGGGTFTYGVRNGALGTGGR